MKSNEDILNDLVKEFRRIGSYNQRDYDYLKKKGHPISTTICRRLKLSGTGIIERTGLKF